MRQRQPGAAIQPLPHAREQKSLLMDRQQHVEMPCRQHLLDKPKETGRVVPQARTMMEFSDKPREPRQAIAVRVADLDVVT